MIGIFKTGSGSFFFFAGSSLGICIVLIYLVEKYFKYSDLSQLVTKRTKEKCNRRKNPGPGKKSAIRIFFGPSGPIWEWEMTISSDSMRVCLHQPHTGSDFSKGCVMNDNECMIQKGEYLPSIVSVLRTISAGSPLSGRTTKHPFRLSIWKRVIIISN